MKRFAPLLIVLALSPLAALRGDAQELRIRPIIGGLPADGGLSLGVELHRTRALGPMDLRLRAIGSTKSYEHLELSLEFPRLGTDWLSAEVKGRYRNYPEEDFWGLGPSTGRDLRSNYRLEDNDTTAVFGVSLGRGIRVAATGGFLNVHTGAGKDDEVPSIEEKFSPLEVPGLRFQPDYWHSGFRVSLDTRDSEGDPFSGSFHQFRWSHFGAREDVPFSFRTYDIELQQFIRTGAASRIALRGRALFNRPLEGHAVPFYLQAWAGGTDTIRGYYQYRFRDRNALIMNAEYRREMASFIDVIGFVDAGRVFFRPSEFAFTGLKASGGLGTRIKLGTRIFFGVDVAGGPEGARLWFRGGHTF